MTTRQLNPLLNPHDADGLRRDVQASINQIHHAMGPLIDEFRRAAVNAAAVAAYVFGEQGRADR